LTSVGFALSCSAKLGALLEDLDTNTEVDDQSSEDADPDRCVVGVDADRRPLIVDPAPELRRSAVSFSLRKWQLTVALPYIFPFAFVLMKRQTIAGRNGNP